MGLPYRTIIARFVVRQNNSETTSNIVGEPLNVRDEYVRYRTLPYKKYNTIDDRMFKTDAIAAEFLVRYEFFRTSFYGNVS